MRKLATFLTVKCGANMDIRKLGKALVGGAAAVLLAFVLAGDVVMLSSEHSAPEQSSKAMVLQAYGNLPLSFEANQGQTDPQVKFFSRGRGYSLFLTATEAVLALSKRAALTTPDAEDTEAPGRSVLRMQLIGANRAPRVAGQEQLPGKSNYFIGNDPKQWRTDVPHYARVKYREVYPGIDLVYYGTNQRQLEYDFIVTPGADPGAIRLGFEGAEEITLDEEGNLVLRTAGGELILHAPVIYQEIKRPEPAGPRGGFIHAHRVRQEIPGGYVLKGNHQVAFQVAAYDASKPLVIDPVLQYSTFLGGSATDGFSAIAVDTDGNAYVTGFTKSFLDFPTANPLPIFGGGFTDAFVTKFNAAGSALVYSTFLGGSEAAFSQEVGFAITVDAAGNAYVTGETNSADFPTTVGAFQTIFNSVNTSDAFVTKLNAAGNALVFSTYLGGNGFDRGNGIAVDAAGNAYVTGETTSGDFPTTVSAFQTTRVGGNFDAFVTKINAVGSALIYSTYLGGVFTLGTAIGEDFGFAIAVDTAGNAYVMGQTRSADFPTTPGAFDTTCGTDGNCNFSTTPGATDAFVTKIDPSKVGAASLVYSTYLGGSNFEEGFPGLKGNKIAVDTAGNAYVMGDTTSADFPTTAGSFQTTKSVGRDAFVAKINAAGSALVYSTFLGGSGDERGHGIAVDPAGQAHVMGETRSADFPTADPIQATCVGICRDAFVTTFNSSGSALVFSTFLGGGGIEAGGGIALDTAGNAYVTGQTASAFFPTTVGAFQTTIGGSFDVFVVKLGALNQPPVADAGLDQTVHPGTSVTLDGTGSSDPDGNTPLTFSWEIITAPAESTVTLLDFDTSMPFFTPDLLGDYTIELVVTDALGGSSAPDQVLISTFNSAPVADAGPDQVVIQLGATVQLDGSQSFDDDGDDFTFSWNLTQKPLDSTAVLSDPTLINPTFVVDVQGDYVISLVVTDIFGAVSGADTVLVSFENVPPIADAGDTQAVVVGDTVFLDGSGSSDANLDPLSFSWSLVSTPEDSAAALDDPEAIGPSFVPDLSGMYTVNLVVNDGFVDSAPDSVTISAISTQDACTSTLGDAIVAINGLDDGVFKNRRLKKALTNKINAMLMKCDQEIVNKLQNDVLAKMNGCAEIGAPDKNDWITECGAQGQVYPLIVQVIDLLRR